MYSYNINLRFDYIYDREASARGGITAEPVGALRLEEKERFPDVRRN
ncbi:MAG: hypothetical protein JSW05_04975 [Candidatus Thorarchaeota archaeon]|nr:MAG: hypothetical protein JSW05_04975 [Candidatus Thorarchaeota archaeon]